MRIFGPGDIFSVSPLPEALGAEEGALSAYSLALGPGPVALYLYLAALPRDKEIGFSTLAEKTDFSLVLLAACAETLEQAGLLRPDKAKVAERRALYRFDIVPLHSLSEIADDPVINELARRRKSIGDLTRLYSKIKEEKLAKIYTEVTSLPFKEELGIQEKGAAKDKETALFSRSAFRERFEQDGGDFSLIAESELKRLEEKIVRLYPLAETEYADLAYKHFKKDARPGQRIDFAGVIEDAKSLVEYPHLRKELPATPEASILEDLQKMESEDFLRKRLQKGHRPAKSDLDIIVSLRESGLTDPSINALLYYVAYAKDGELPKKYIEKIGGSIVRKRLSRADETLDYLRRTEYRFQNKDRKVPVSEEVPVQNVEATETEEEEDIDVAALIAEMKGKK